MLNNHYHFGIYLLSRKIYVKTGQFPEGSKQSTPQFDPKYGPDDGKMMKYMLVEALICLKLHIKDGKFIFYHYQWAKKKDERICFMALFYLSR